MKKLLLFSLLATFILTGCSTNNYQQDTAQNNSNYSNNQEWKSLNSTKGKFMINFPLSPIPETSDSTYTQTLTYHTEDTEGTFYVARVVIYSDIIDKAKIEAGLEHALNGIIDSSKGDELISSNFDYMPATRVGDTAADAPEVLDYVIKNTNEDRYIQGRMIIVDNIYYDLKVVSYTNYWNKADYDKFIDSFSPTY